MGKWLAMLSHEPAAESVPAVLVNYHQEPELAYRGFTLAELEREAADDWPDIRDDPEQLEAFVHALNASRTRQRGETPDHYTQQSECTHCGPVWLWFSGKVQGCPWCWNRAADRPIPRPHSVQCCDCIHFRRNNHPHLGYCAKGEPEPNPGLWDTDRRNCAWWLPAG